MEIVSAERAHGVTVVTVQFEQHRRWYWPFGPKRTVYQRQFRVEDPRFGIDWLCAETGTEIDFSTAKRMSRLYRVWVVREKQLAEALA